MGFILVGIDGSPTSRKAFHEAVREATWRETTVNALHVVHFPYLVGYENIGLSIETLQTSGKELLTREIELLAETYGGQFPVDVQTTVAFGHSGVEIAAAANPRAGGAAAELVVLGSRGYGGLRGMMLGSVTTYAVHHLTCPLLVIPADDDE